MTREETASIIAVLCAAFPQVPVSRETIEVYHTVIGDLDFDRVSAAVRGLLATQDRFPPPAMIRREVASASGLLAPAPAQAWGEVTAEISRCGSRATPTFSHPAISATVSQIGWWDICMSTSIDTVRAHFLRAYDIERSRLDTELLQSEMTAIGPCEVRRAILPSL